VPDAKFHTDLPVSFVRVGLYLIKNVTRLDVVRSVAGDKDILTRSEWHPDRFEQFQRELRDSVIAVGDALSATSAAEADRLWREAFGE
jgi:hypothetical protein